jgi:hypothetical protein
LQQTLLKMTLTIKSTANKEGIQNALKTLKNEGKLNAYKHFGKIKLKESPLKIQKIMRNEWS